MNNNDKRTGRLNSIRHVLALLPYDTKDESTVGTPEPEIVAPVRALLPGIRSAGRIRR